MAAATLALLRLAATVGSGAEGVPKGRVLERVQCVAEANQTYALYVRTRFEPNRRWPVLFCFDPGARGVTPVERFQAAAEKFGYLVAGSNHSRNGPWEANVAAITAMIRDVERHFPLEANRVYVAGLSGGARVACQLAVSGLAHGVIACSAGFMNSETPAKVPFPFFGTAGVTDFNYLELRRVDRELDERHAVHRVVIHGGGHEWLTSELALEAVAWLELQAMRAGTTPRDEAWIREQWAARTAAIPAEPLDERLRALRAIVADFDGFVAIDELKRDATALASSPAWRDAAKAERAAEQREQRVRDGLLSAVEEGFTSPVAKTATELRAQEQTGTLADRQMATRVLQAAFMACSENARPLMRAENFADAAPLLEMMTTLRPERTNGWLDLARARARLGDRKRALAALRSAVAAGFRDAARLEQDLAFTKLKTDPEFCALLASLR